jgi:uncharacterized repeat protein (TIGR01451 family)
LFGKNLSIVNNSSYWGGGLGNEGTLILVDSTVGNNRALGAVGSGGGIDSRGETTLVNLTITDNSAPFGGGIRNWGHLRLINSTVSTNTATASIGGGISNESILDVINSTISGNTANSAGGGIGNDSLMSLANVTLAYNTATSGGGAIYIYNEGLLDIENTLLAYNFSSGENNSCSAPAGSITSYGYNMEDGFNSCSLSAPGDKTGIDPQLGPLQNNGGTTYIHALTAGSPAIDAGNPEGCKAEGGTRELLNDQRSFAGPIDGDGDGKAVCDIGAYEYGAGSGIGSDVDVNAWGTPNPAPLNGNFTYNILVTNHGPQMAAGIVIMDVLPTNVTWVSSAINNGICVGSKTVKCYVGALFTDDAVMPVITVKPNGSGIIDNSVTVTSTSPDPTSTDNSTLLTILTSDFYPVRRLAGNTIIGYDTSLQSGIDAALDFNYIEAMAITFTGDITFNASLSVVIRGGYDPDFSSRTSYTTIAGSLTVETGSMAGEYLIIK